MDRHVGGHNKDVLFASTQFTAPLLAIVMIPSVYIVHSKLWFS